ncbi:MAG: hypothetical protein OP8BY_0034 [Candidatus Saccharicenans subterraneus]|uniref:Uncharacterized protein n=1 Tax=Candidatus Saccharicenans subterraneus TaxID=2508984 RepID=A0A3E2BLM3_9BACT|nr:MAG: hypothetical protein OP8BY_0034 [Candidatus Saccharicenans subterraneum]
MNGHQLRKASRKKSRLVLLSTAALILTLVGSAASPLSAGGRNALYFFELQAVSAYNFSDKSFESFSYLSHHPMQKNGLGLETLIRFYRRKADLGFLSLQARAVYDREHDLPIRLQLYNAFFRLKTPLAEIWAGHGKPALGLNYNLDNHALLLPDATMLGHNLDRDWGVGLHRDFRRGDSALSLTTGSGMNLKFHRNYLLSGRISYGVLARDNYNLGLSAFTGRVLEAMGTEEPVSGPVPWSGISLDSTYFWLNLETRLEANLGRRAGQPWHLVLLRQGLNLLDEGRLKLEAQLGLWQHGSGWNYLAGPALTYRLNSDLALRTMFLYDSQAQNSRLAVQLYFYRSIF